jgi:hypothetical protein
MAWSVADSAYAHAQMSSIVNAVLAVRIRVSIDPDDLHAPTCR